MKTLTTLLLSFIFFTVVAQKQPQIQEISVRAPANVKIDGKKKEWPSPFQNDKNTDTYLSAYNSTNRYYYTIANDDNTLYIILRGLGTAAAQKALIGGVTFTINKAADKKIKANTSDNIVITFPMPQGEKITDNIMGPIFSLCNYLPDTVYKRKQIDSLINLGTSRASDALKEIGIAGIKEIAEPAISIYNENGVKAAFGFMKRQPVIELAIPLKYIGLDVTGQSKFAYNIKLTGLVLPAGVQMDRDMNINAMYGISSTDFGGRTL